MDNNLTHAYLCLVSALDTEEGVAGNQLEKTLEEHRKTCEAKPGNCPYEKKIVAEMEKDDDVDRMTGGATGYPSANRPAMQSTKKRSDGLYSKIGKALELAKGKISLKGLVPYLKGKGVKDDELNATNLAGFVSNAQKAGVSSVTPSDVDRWVASHGYSLEKKTVGYSGTKMRGAKLMKPGDVKQPGGSNYREVLFRDPNLFFGDGQYSHRTGEFDGDPSIVAHARVQDMDVEGGGKCLLVEEAQSDYHEAGSKQGYNKNQSRIDDIASELDSLGEQIWDMQSKWEADCERIENENYTAAQFGREKLLSEDELVERFTDIYPERLDDLKNREDALLEERSRLVSEGGAGGVQDAPYKKDWMKYVMKQMFIEAAEKGYDFVAWTGGASQDARMGTKHQISGLKVYKTARYKNGAVVGDQYRVSYSEGGEQKYVDFNSPADVEAHLGKGVLEAVDKAGKFFQEPGTRMIYSDSNHMSAVYDKGGTSSNNIPKIVQQYIRKWGGEVGDVKLANGNTVLGFRIPQAMRDEINNNGLPAFDELDKETAAALIAYLNETN